MSAPVLAFFARAARVAESVRFGLDPFPTFRLRRKDAASMESALNLALQTIEKLAPDPLGMGSRRILLSEYGLFENSLVGGTTWRAPAILAAASHAGIYGAFLWNLYDNQCVKPDGQPAEVDTPVGSPIRPTNSDCVGLWVIRPDGTTSPVLAVLKQYWH